MALFIHLKKIKAKSVESKLLTRLLRIWLS